MKNWMKPQSYVNILFLHIIILESWGDAEPKSGYISFIQPTIYPFLKHELSNFIIKMEW